MKGTLILAALLLAAWTALAQQSPAPVSKPEPLTSEQILERMRQEWALMQAARQKQEADAAATAAALLRAEASAQAADTNSRALATQRAKLDSARLEFEQEREEQRKAAQDAPPSPAPQSVVQKTWLDTTRDAVIAFGVPLLLGLVLAGLTWVAARLKAWADAGKAAADLAVAQTEAQKQTAAAAMEQAVAQRQQADAAMKQAIADTAGRLAPKLTAALAGVGKTVHDVDESDPTVLAFGRLLKQINPDFTAALNATDERAAFVVLGQAQKQEPNQQVASAPPPPPAPSPKVSVSPPIAAPPVLQLTPEHMVPPPPARTVWKPEPPAFVPPLPVGT